MLYLPVQSIMSITTYVLIVTPSGSNTSSFLIFADSGIVPNGIHNVNGEYVVGESWGYVYSTTRYQLDFLNGVLVDIR